jgi:hypothetical protein
MENTNTINRTSLYCVVYRRGGTENFTWHRTLGMTREEAKKACEDTARMGYKAFVANYRMSMIIGLPETYEIGDRLP